MGSRHMRGPRELLVGDPTELEPHRLRLGPGTQDAEFLDFPDFRSSHRIFRTPPFRFFCIRHDLAFFAIFYSWAPSADRIPFYLIVNRLHRI